MNADFQNANRLKNFRQNYFRQPGIALLVVSLIVLPSFALGQHVVLNANQYEPWEISYQSALQKSKETGRPIMLVFSGSDWCKWCKKLTNDVFSTHEFARWSTDNVIKVEVDFPTVNNLPTQIKRQNELLKAKFGHIVRVYPTVLFVNSDGLVIGKTGYVDGGVENWIDKASEIVAPNTTNDLLAIK